MTTETYVNHCHILAVTDRQPPLPPLVFITDQNGNTERLALVDVQRRLRQMRAGVEVYESAERMLTPEPEQTTDPVPGAASDAPASS